MSRPASWLGSAPTSASRSLLLAHPVLTRQGQPARKTGPLTVTAMFQTGMGNPALRHVEQAGYSSPPPVRRDSDNEMTVTGTVDRSALLLLITTGFAAYTWAQLYSGAMAASAVLGMTKGAGIGALVLAMVTAFKPDWSPYSAPVYAGLKGVALGGTSAMLETVCPGVVIQALCGTFGTLFALLAAFRARIIEVNEGFRTAVSLATVGFFVGILGMMLLRMCGVAMPSMMSGPFAIGVGVVSVTLAAFNLLTDFDDLQQMAWQGAPKYMEWYGGFSLLVTLVWMYTSLLQLLMALSGGSRD
eukprot:CAMPEP_0117658932 /NCGR_PEP_ID=MMETSP0804-20121206/6140_1 /TAXON_ID=1074897 /ORGANISM="Tetraselmis astigmatica, Strain CCMP880" /LENGTH=300 /DNA_ID=CAMNT_0005465511 /DNA_START=454 /DNA_END=1356 /DNA_ORIENTATION=-